MRITKGMKKALSMFLTGALVVTGASIPATQTKAASAEKLTWEGTLKATGFSNVERSNVEVILAPHHPLTDPPAQTLKSAQMASFDKSCLS